MRRKASGKELVPVHMVGLHPIDKTLIFVSLAILFLGADMSGHTTEEIINIFDIEGLVEEHQELVPVHMEGLYQMELVPMHMVGLHLIDTTTLSAFLGFYSN